MNSIENLNFDQKVEAITNKSVALVHAIYGVKRGNKEDLEMAKVLVCELRDIALDLVLMAESKEIERKVDKKKLEIMSFMLK